MIRKEFSVDELLRLDGADSSNVDPEIHQRIEEISNEVATLFGKRELGVYFGYAISYVALGGNDKNLLAYAKRHSDPGIQESLPKALAQLRDLKERHPELFA